MHRGADPRLPTPEHVSSMYVEGKMSELRIAGITVEDPEKFHEYLAETRKVAAPYGAELFGGAVESGHYLAEEAPDEVLARFRDFFG